MRTIIGIEPGINKAYSIYDEQTGKVHKMEQVVVANVTSGSAAYGKLKSGDILKSVTIDGKTYDITRKFDVFDAMLKVKNSDDFTSVVSFVIIRDGREMTVTVDISGVTPQAW
jgi:S1-C subfamily serine protease